MAETKTFSCGCSCVHDPFFTVSVRSTDLVCPVHIERAREDGDPETLAFFSDVEEVGDLYLKASTAFASSEAERIFEATFPEVKGYRASATIRLRLDGATVDAASFTAAGLTYIPGSPRKEGRISVGV